MLQFLFRRKKNLASFAITFLILVGISWEKSVTARPAVNVTNIEIVESVELFGSQYLRAIFNVPQSNYRQNAGNGLRWIDLHYAKMIEVTDWQCKNWEQSPIPRQGEQGIVWIYSGNNGNNWFGLLTIDCQGASNILREFPMQGAEATKVFYYETSRNYRIPTVALTSDREKQAWRTNIVDNNPLQTSP